MIILGTLWGVIATGAMIYAASQPYLDRNENQERFKRTK